MRVRTLFVVLLMLLGTPTLARATWSIVAVDQSSLEVGVGAASCIGGVDIVVGLVPGHGAVAAQAFANLDARDEAARLLAAGTPPSEVVERITSVDFDPEAWYSQWWSGMGIRQYGVVGLGGTPSAVSFTGELTVESSGSGALWRSGCTDEPYILKFVQKNSDDPRTSTSRSPSVKELNDPFFR